MQAGNGGNRRAPMADINVTPLVDVMLVLLIIFMVTAPMMVQGIDVDLPKVDAPAIRQEEERLMVTVDRDRKIFLNQYPVDLGELGPKLLAIYRNQSKKQGVFLQADEGVPYGYVVQVMGTIRAAGIEQIGMMTEPVKGAVEKKAGK